MLVGEQPGDYEDVAGKPFVGPAGKIMDRALEEAGIDRKEVYITNAVKHFKWEPRRKRRIHQNQTHARSPLVARGLKWSCDSLGRNCLSFSARPPVRRSSGLRFESRASSGRFFLQSSRPKSWLRSILRRCCGSQMKNRAIANTRSGRGSRRGARCLPLQGCPPRLPSDLPSLLRDWLRCCGPFPAAGQSGTDLCGA